ncbi:MAG: hypothetical protein LBN36_06860 [Clostridiales Family XIII bacterium]|jgi:hypothetical protein|nr:hypothetical protein [Clostridiales Family XIII bacterium]
MSLKGFALDQPIINLELLPPDEKKMLDVLERGDMVACRSGNDFLYIMIEKKTNSFRVFSHSPGLPEGGTQIFPRDEKNNALIGKFVQIADAAYMIELEEHLNLFGVMASAEDGILSMFPSGDKDQDGEIEFMIPESDGGEAEEDTAAQKDLK